MPTSIRSSGIPVGHGLTSELDSVLDDVARRAPRGDGLRHRRSRVRGDGPRQVTDPGAVEGLEFDLVVLVEPDSFGDGIEGAVDRYVAMTRATQQLVVLSGP